ncbi:serine hydrolase domain-containing protein [Parapedomonas caeni]
MMRPLTVCAVLLALTAGVANAAPVDTGAAASLDAVMQALPLVAADPARPEAVHNAVAVVEDRAGALLFGRGVGPARDGQPALITPDDQFPIASVTKTMTATIILQLAEEGAFGATGLDTTLGSLGVLPPEVLARLLIHQGRAYGAGLTLRQLLAHRAGLRDVFMDDARETSDARHGEAAPDSLGGVLLAGLGAHRQCLATPGCDVAKLVTGRTWRPWDARRPTDPQAGVLNFFLNYKGGATNALFAPGAGYHYSDTGYIILGLVIEKVTGGTLHQAYRARLFDPLGMGHSYLDYAVAPAAAAYTSREADFYIGDFAGRTGKFNISFDWAGGGVVSTASELNRFIRALGEGRLFRKPETLALMLTPHLREERNGLIVERGLGVARLTTADGISCYGHTGFWGAIMLYEPSTGISLAGTLNQVGHNPAGWAIELMRAARAQRPPASAGQ